jgi:diaminohydroxyphosphoribosylaminopyrimidine deaminase / 5-amino-6-(5-phosphoribosylamino)uracil reductase
LAYLGLTLGRLFDPTPRYLIERLGMTDTRQFEPMMHRALELALLGPAYGANPQVGAIILDKDLNIIAEGWHKGAGTPHAEVDALSKLPNGVPAGSTAVVTLEPCNHTGRTGPCAVALIEAGISRVVYASKDPGDESANGAKTLTDAGVEVIQGVLEKEADEQSVIWLTAMKKQRPYITLKWAQTLDGRTAATDKTSKWISGSVSREDVHLRRSNLDAILVGTGTVKYDNPDLTARKPDGSRYEHQPLRVVVGMSELDQSLRVFNEDAPTVQLKTQDVRDVVSQLWDRGMRHILVEGGAQLASEFISLGLFDEILIYQAPLLVGGTNVAVTEIGVATMANAVELDFVEVKQLGADVFMRAIPRKGN